MIVEILKKIKKIESKKIVNVLSVFVTMFMLLSSLNAFAADEQVPKIDSVKGYQQVLKTTQILTKDPSYNSQTTMQNTILGSLNGIAQEIVPQIYSNYSDLQASNEVSPYVKGGLIGMADSANMAMLDGFNGVNVQSHLAQEWVPGYTTDTSIYAASDGYGYLVESGINNLWDKIRLIAYVIFVVVLIVAGFMIMFRQKIGGQLAVSVFNALPNVIIALILVTFSFAIVGLILNLGVMLINVISSVLGISAANAVTVDGPFSLFAVLFRGDYFNATVTPALAAGLAPALIGAVIAGFTPAGFALGGAILAGLAVLIIIAIIIAGIIVYASVRVYITMLTAFLGIILNTVLAPLILAVSAFPGMNGLATDWFKKIIKGALTFPIIYLFLNLGMYILNGDVNIGFPSGIMSGDFNNVPTGGTMIGVVLKGVLVIVLFFYAAEAPKLMDDFIATNSGKGAQGAIEGLKKGLSKVTMGIVS